MIVGLQSLTLKCIARVFSLKSSLEKLLTISWVMWAYIILVKEWEKAHLKSSKHWVSSVTCDLAWVAKWLVKSSLAWDCLDSSICFSRDLLWVVTHEPVTNSPSSQIFTKLSHLTFKLNPTKNTRKWLNKKYNQIWHRIKANKNIVVNHNFTPVNAKNIF